MVGFQRRKRKRKKKKKFLRYLRNRTWEPLLLNQHNIPLDNMSRTPKGEINFCIHSCGGCGTISHPWRYDFNGQTTSDLQTNICE